MSKHPTEKDRVGKVVERAFNQMQFYGINVPDRIKNVEYFTRLILREIKRAERRVRDIERASWMHTIKDVEIKMAQNDAIRNRRKV